MSLFGVLMIVSITSKGDVTGYSVGIKQLLCLGIGLVMMVICSVVPIESWKKMSGIMWIIALFFLVCTLIPGVGVKSGGAQRWLDFKVVQFQPLEILTFVLPIHLSKCLFKVKAQEHMLFLRVTMVIVALSIIPLILQPTTGGTILVISLCLAVHMECRGVFFPLLGGVILGAVLFPWIITAEYRVGRIAAFLDPWQVSEGAGYQIIQGLIAFANGGAWGVGLGKGLQKLNYLPAAHTDYIFPAIAEELGLVGTLGTILAMGCWFLTLMGLYCRQTDPFRATLVWGMTISIALPIFINLGGVMNLMPLTGIPFPFLSSGGSSLLLTWMKIGVLCGIARDASHNSAPL
jgi:cell division protein FtsW